MKMWCGARPEKMDRETLKSDDSDCSSHTSSNPNSPEEVNIVVLGASRVGKTMLCNSFLQQKHQQKTILPTKDFCYDTCEIVENEASNVKLFDVWSSLPITGHLTTRSRGRDFNLKRTMEKGDGFVLVYSITDRGSMFAVRQLYSYLQHIRNCRDLPLVLVGNKSDIATQRSISVGEGRQTAFDMGTAFYETSALTDSDHVTKIFHDVILQIRCVRLRKELEKGREGFCGVRGLIGRLSMRKERRKGNHVRQNTTEHWNF